MLVKVVQHPKFSAVPCYNAATDSPTRRTERRSLPNDRLVAVAAEFLKAFPMLEDVLIESWQEGMGVSNPFTHTMPSRGYGRPHSLTNWVIACANRNCKDGGFDIHEDLSKMVHERLVRKEFVQVCRGNEGSPKGLGRCVNTLHYRLTLEYTPGSRHSRGIP